MAFYVDFGHVRIPRDLNVPPSLRMLGIEPQSKLNCEVRTTMTNMIMILMMKMRTETTNDRCWMIKLALRFVGRLRGRAL